MVRAGALLPGGRRGTLLNAGQHSPMSVKNLLEASFRGGEVSPPQKQPERLQSVHKDVRAGDAEFLGNWVDRFEVVPAAGAQMVQSGQAHCRGSKAQRG